MAKFQTSARSVDMLGRQQIAGIPTAVSEIFKNAYDAYATSVRGDYFPRDRILMIRDDGIGMTEADFLARWLTIGTDSKAAGGHLPKLPRPTGVSERRQMGEKGIGRLAIATTGPQLLVVTRAHETYQTPNDCLVVALLQWALFEVPGLTLDDVVIPLRVVPSAEALDRNLIQEMGREVQSALRALGKAVPPARRKQILGELALLDFEPAALLGLNGPSPLRGPGTAFIIRPSTEDVDAAMEVRDLNPNEYSVSEFQRFLLGFTNTISPDEQTPTFATEFIRHDDSAVSDIIDPGSYFWGSEDFSMTDHTVEGEFDEYGKFVGRLSVYGRDAEELVEPWRGSSGAPSACGPFKIKFGYVQGKASESRLSAEDFTLMTRRLEKIGGLYVYRDGIRVLPYGNSDYDYLEIEKRRSLNAGDYYFSYRRMFGAIRLDSKINSGLQEKAGREGFRENRAYRDFKDILKGFLIQLAANAFSAEGESAEDWRTERERLRRQSAATSRRAEAERKTRLRFAKAVAERLDYIESGKLTDDLLALVTRVAENLTQAPIQGLRAALLREQNFAVSRLSKIRDYVRLQRPGGVALTREEERDWRSLHGLAEYAAGLISDSSNELAEIFERESARLSDSDVRASSRSGTDARVQAAISESTAAASDLVGSIRKATADVGRELNEAAQAELALFDAELAAILEQIASLDFADEVAVLEEIARVGGRHVEMLRLLLSRVESLREAESNESELIALKEQVLDLQDQLDDNLELLQLGQAVQIVSHEFDASIKSVRRGLQQLAPWARSTPRLRPVVQDLRASFAHLDGYLRLFTPLQRRLYRTTVTLSGGQVEAFVRGVFADRLKRHEIALEATPAFLNWSFTGFPSTFYPVFINLVDNAIHWVSDERTRSRVIQLDADESGLYVRDTGPGVRPRDERVIFERGFSRRRGGRGLGLSLAREVLERDGWLLDYISSDVGATFRLSPVTASRR